MNPKSGFLLMIVIGGCIPPSHRDILIFFFEEAKLVHPNWHQRDLEEEHTPRSEAKVNTTRPTQVDSKIY
jgi:hypothetical protein